MLRTLIALVLALLLATPVAAEPEGLISKPSPYSVSETLDRLEARLTAKGIAIVTRWDHAARAAGVGIELRPTELLLFGNPALGSHFFTSNQTAGIDLPMKALAWQDADGQVWLSYNDPAYLAARHGITDRDEVVARMQKALAGLTDATIAPD